MKTVTRLAAAQQYRLRTQQEEEIEPIPTQKWLDRLPDAGRLAWSIFTFYLFSGLIHLVSWAIPDLKIQQPVADTFWTPEDVHLLWIRGESYNSDWISMQNFFTYVAMNAVGFIFVQKVTQKQKA